MPELRPVRDGDIASVIEVFWAALDDLAARNGRPPAPRNPTALEELIRHLVSTDPGLGIVADDGGGSWRSGCSMPDPASASSRSCSSCRRRRATGWDARSSAPVAMAPASRVAWARAPRPTSRSRPVCTPPSAWHRERPSSCSGARCPRTSLPAAAGLRPRRLAEADVVGRSMTPCSATSGPPIARVLRPLGPSAAWRWRTAAARSSGTATCRRAAGSARSRRDRDLMAGLLGHLARSVVVPDGWQAVVPGTSRALPLLLAQGLRIDATPAVYCATMRVRTSTATCRRASRSSSERPDARSDRDGRAVPRLPDPSTELGAAWLELAMAAATKPTPSRRFVPPGHRGRGQAGCLVRDGGRYGGRADDPDPHRGAVPRARARGRGVRRGAGRRRAGGRRWIIDPIDGTHSYMRGVPLFATLLAFEVGGSARRSAVVSAPALRRRWFAWRDGGAGSMDTGRDRHRLRSATRSARLRGREPRGRPSRALVVADLAPRRTQRPGFVELAERVWRDRGFGDFWGYILVAEGAAELMLESRPEALGHRGASPGRRGGGRAGHRPRGWRGPARERRPGVERASSTTTLARPARGGAAAGA